MRLAALGRPLRVLGEPDASSLGAAMLAAMAGGRSPSDVAGLRGEVDVVHPSAAQVAGAGARFERYLQAVDATLAWSG